MNFFGLLVFFLHDLGEVAYLVGRKLKGSCVNFASLGAIAVCCKFEYL